MDLQLINEDLCESRLYRTTQQFKFITGREIANLTYLNTLLIYLMLQDDKQHAYAKQYAKQTAQYSGYTLFRTHATDLYMLCYAINDPDTKHLRFEQHGESKRFLKTLQFTPRRHQRFIRKLSLANDTKGEAVSYFLSLERQLKITDGRYLRWRRYVTDWGNLKFTSRQNVIATISQEIRRVAKGSELLKPLQTMLKYRNYRPHPEYKAPRTSFTKRAIGTAAGAVAGRYAGKKIAQRLGKDQDNYKKAGTGIGAIAGYWASGRKKQT